MNNNDWGEIPIPEKINIRAKTLKDQPKKTLNDIMRDWQEVENLLIESGGEFTPEIEGLMEITEDEFEAKFDGYAGFINYLKGQIEYLKKEEDKYRSRRRTLENSILKCKDNIVFAMNHKHIDRLKTPKYSFSIRTTESWQVDVMAMMAMDEEQEREILESGDAIRGSLKISVKNLKQKYGDNPPKWVDVVKKESINIR